MKYILAFSNDEGYLNSRLFDTLEDAENTAKDMIKEYNEKGYTINIEDVVSGEPDGKHIDYLTVIAVECDGLPDFGELVEDGMNDFYADMGIDDDFYFEKQDLEKLNNMITKFIKENGYGSKWYTIKGYKAVTL